MDVAGILSAINPGLVLIAAGLLMPVLPKQGRDALLVLAPVLGVVVLLNAQFGVETAKVSLMGWELSFYRADALSFPFGLAFLIAALLNGVYSLHLRDRLQDAAGLIYSGAAVAAAFAGDFLSLFLFWELTAIASVFLIWASGSRKAYYAGLRYLAIQILSGVLLLAGAAQMATATGSLAFNQIGLDAPGGLLIFLAFGIKAAFPFLHNWLQDAYPEATPTGAVILSAFTTKLAVLALLRGFPGEESLIWIGAIMTVFPVFFAVVENDLRRVLAYSLNNQVGFMVCAIGIGTPLALNGATAHAFAHILYKGLLFMAMGAVLHRVGTTKASELGGLHRTMPFTALCCIIGAASISAFPLFSGFVAKSLTMSAVHDAHMIVVWLMLLFASAGVLEHSGIKIPYFAFFGHDSGLRPREAPFNMQVAMGAAAGLCIFIGVYPAWLYSILPFQDAAAYQPYTVDHVLTQMQLLVAAAFAFALLKRFKVYPPEKRGVILDTDWTYRRLGFGIARWTAAVVDRLSAGLAQGASAAGRKLWDRLVFLCSPEGVVSHGGLTTAMAVWAAVLLAATMLLSFFSA